MIPLSNIKKDAGEKKQVFIDLNCDLGQSYGVYKNDLEYSLLPYVSSVNISCGGHAGDPSTITNAIKTAKQYNLAIGAHIGYFDIQGFGYRSIKLDEEELQALVLYQIGALNSIAKAYNVTIEHVRPHGALYKQAAEDFNVSLAIANAVNKFDPWLIYIGAAGETLNKVSETTKIRVAPEIHLDKKYNTDGSADFEISDVIDFNYSIEQLNNLVKYSAVKNNQNGKTKIDFKTIHLNVKTSISMDIAKKAKEIIKEPVPVALSFVESSGWV